MTQQHAIEFNQVVKRYGNHEALRGVSFTVNAGDYFGLIGANGAGKTTLIKSLLDFCDIDGGTISIFGRPHSQSHSRMPLAFLPEQFNPPYFLTGQEFLRMMSRFHARLLTEDEQLSTVNALQLEAGALAKPVRSLSKGMAQKLGLAACLLSGKQVLVLDEPMSGLDPKARALVTKQLLARRDSEQTVFFSTHLLSDVETLCTRLAVLHAGELRFVGTTAAFKQAFAADSIEAAYLSCVTE